MPSRSETAILEHEGALAAPATFVSVVGGNDLFWRLEAPARAIGAKTLVVPEADQSEFLEPTADGVFRWEPTDDGADYPDVEGAVVWTRPDGIRSVHADAQRQNGHLVVGEVDDNYISNPRLNIFLRAAEYGNAQAEHLTALASMDRVVYSTDWLRDRYWKAMRKMFPGKTLPEPFVCRNNIAESDWPTPIPRDGPLRVTWMGSPSHVWDIDLAWPAMMHAKRNLGCETIVMGYDPSQKQGDSERSLGKSAQWARAISRIIPWQTPEAYHRQAVPADIGLCPLIRNDQTLGKSDVKFVEYAMSGAAVVAQNNEVYNRTIVHGETGLLVGSPQEMLDAVDLLYRDEKLRETLVENARRYVREERGLQQLREEWGEAVSV